MVTWVESFGKNRDLGRVTTKRDSNQVIATTKLIIRIWAGDFRFSSNYYFSMFLQISRVFQRPFCSAFGRPCPVLSMYNTVAYGGHCHRRNLLGDTGDVSPPLFQVGGI